MSRKNRRGGKGESYRESAPSAEGTGGAMAPTFRPIARSHPRSSQAQFSSTLWRRTHESIWRPAANRGVALDYGRNGQEGNGYLGEGARMPKFVAILTFQ